MKDILGRALLVMMALFMMAMGNLIAVCRYVLMSAQRLFPCRRNDTRPT